MKAYLALISAAALALSACSQEPAKPAEAAPASAPAAEASAPAAEASAPASAPATEASAPAASEAAAAPAADDKCSVTVEANDAMQFNTKDIQVSKACKEFTVNLKHVGTMEKIAMGHNVVITKEADVEGVLADGAKAGIDADYVKAGDARVVGYTKLIGGGETASVTIDPAKLAGGSHKFFCSFPGHIAMMSGTVTLVD